MDFAAKRLCSGFLAFTWLVLSLLIPGSAYAVTYNASQTLSGKFYVLPYGATSPIIATAATMLGRANPWIAAITLGTPVMQFLLERQAGGQVALVPRYAPQQVNGGVWTNGVPAATTSSSSIYTSSWTGGQYPTAAEACNATCVAQAAYTNNSASCQSITSSTGGACYGITPRSPGGEAMGTYTTTTGCPQGYTLSGGYCTISDPWSVKWPSDGVGTMTPKLDGTGLEAHPQDPDPLASSPTPSEVQNPSMDYSPDPYGNPTSTTIQPQSGGGFKIDQRVQTTTGNQTTTTINNIIVNNAGNVTNIFTTTVPGTIDLASPTATPVGSGASPTINFPTDYNRETTQQQAVQKLDDLKTGAGAADAPNYQAETDAKKQSMNDELKEKAEAIPGQYADDKAKWFSWVWTPPVGQCEPWISSIHGQTVSLNVCPYVDKIRDVIGYMLAVVSAVAVYSQLFRRED